MKQIHVIAGLDESGRIGAKRGKVLLLGPVYCHNFLARNEFINADDSVSRKDIKNMYLSLIKKPVELKNILLKLGIPLF